MYCRYGQKGFFLWVLALFYVWPIDAVGQTPSSAGNPLNALPRTQLAPSIRTKPQVDITPPRPESADILSRTVTPRQFDIVGVRSVPFKEVAKVFVPLAGKTISVQRIVETSTQVTKLYQDAGYALSFAFIPPQDFHDGVVKIVIVEGYIAKINIEGDAGRSEALLREIAAPLLQERPLRTETFEKQALLMARLPGVEVSASAQPPTTTDGATTLQLKAKYNPVTFSLGGEIQDPTPRAIASLTVNDPLWSGSQLQGSTLLRPFNKERFVSLGFNQVLNTYGTTLTLNGSDYYSNDSNDIFGSSIEERVKQKKIDISVLHPLLLSRREILTLATGIYGVDYEKRYLAPSSGNFLNDEEQIRAIYGRLTWMQEKPESSRNVSFMIAQGLDAAGASLSRTNNFGATLADNPARLDFTRFTLDAGQRYRFSGGWGAAVAIGGQYSPDILPTSERVSFGGSRFGRGYQSGEVSADSGLGGSIEVNHNFPIPTVWLKQVEPYLLFEAAKTWQQQENVESANLSSASIGLRLNDGHYYALDLAVSKPLGDRGTDNPNRNVHVSLFLSYKLDF